MMPRDPSKSLDAIIRSVARLCRCDDESVSLRYSKGQWCIDVLHVEGETGDPEEDPAPEGSRCTMLAIAEAETLAAALDQVRKRAPGWRVQAQAQIERETREERGVRSG